jgi:hypothetical protein
VIVMKKETLWRFTLRVGDLGGGVSKTNVFETASLLKFKRRRFLAEIILLGPVAFAN